MQQRLDPTKRKIEKPLLLCTLGKATTGDGQNQKHLSQKEEDKVPVKAVCLRSECGHNVRNTQKNLTTQKTC